MFFSQSVFLSDVEEFVRSNGLTRSWSVHVWLKTERDREIKTITHRNAGQSCSPSIVTIFRLWYKDVLELLSPTAAVYHSPISTLLMLYVIIIAIISTVHPPMACCGLSHEYFTFLSLIHMYTIVLLHSLESVEQMSGLKEEL